MKISNEKMNQRIGKIPIGIACVILGVLLAIQFKSVSVNSAVDDLNSTRAQTLQELLNDERESNSKLSDEISSLEKELAIYRAASEDGEDSDVLLGEIGRLEMISGLTDVTGEGVEVVLDDSSAANTSGNEADYIIHDSDILSVINELRDAGAEVLALNGNRILSTTEIRCSGSVVTINGTRTSAPFIIDAIGDSNTMFNALMMRNGVVDILKQWQIKVEVTQLDSILIPGYGGTIDYKYASTLAPEDTIEGGEGVG